MTPPATPGGACTEQVLHSFGKAGDGINPPAGLLETKDGLAGVTLVGGDNNLGTVFLLKPPAAPGAPWTETILHSFAAGGDATFPSSDLIADADGNLFGATALGTEKLIFSLAAGMAPNLSGT